LEYTQLSVIQNQLLIAAAGSNNNLLAGSAFEFARERQLISIGVTASVAGGFIGLTVGADLVLEDTPPFVSAAYPIIPDHMFYNDVAMPGDRIVLRARNPSGAGITFSWLVQISQVR
jgi:hypothetical protein